MQIAVQINTEQFMQIDKHLAGLEMLKRAPAIKKGLGKGGDVVVQHIRETLPKPGYAGDKPELKPLRDTTRSKVREYQSGKLVLLVGYEWGAGSHGHNVEEGHDIVVGGKAVRKGAASRQVIAPDAVLKAMGLGPDGAKSGRRVGRVKGRYDIANAAKRTEAAQAAAIEAGIQEAIEATKK